MPIAAWRKAARAVGRELGRPVRTIVAGANAQAYLVDWPANELEEQVQMKQMRLAVSRAALGVDSEQRLTPPARHGELTPGP